MSTINVEKVFEHAGRDDTMSVTYAFKLSLEQKEHFFQVCEDRGLSPGKVIRALLGQFLEGADNVEV
jgi:hypothetical protein